MTESELIQIIDHPKYRNTIDREEARKELKNRSLSSEILRASALEVNEKIAYAVISNEDIMSETVSMHDSEFLSLEDMRGIYLKQLEKFILYKDQFRFDVRAYAIGGI